MIQEAYAKTHWASKGVRIVSYRNQDAVYQDLISGRLDAALQDAVHADLGFLALPVARTSSSLAARSTIRRSSAGARASGCARKMRT